MRAGDENAPPPGARHAAAGATPTAMVFATQLPCGGAGFEAGATQAEDGDGDQRAAASALLPRLPSATLPLSQDMELLMSQPTAELVDVRWVGHGRRRAQVNE